MTQKCKVEVEKVYQSPTTPVHEVAYLIQIEFPEDAVDFERQLLRFLEDKSIPDHIKEKT